MPNAAKLLELHKKFRLTVQIVSVFAIAEAVFKLSLVPMLIITAVTWLLKCLPKWLWTVWAVMIGGIIFTNIVQFIIKRTAFRSSGFLSTKTGKKVSEAMSKYGASYELIAELERILADTSNVRHRVSIIHSIGDIYVDLGEFSRAYSVLSPLDPTAMTEPDGYYMTMLEIYSETGDIQSADRLLADCVPYIERSAKHLDSYMGTCMCYQKYLIASGRFDEAFELLSALYFCRQDMGSADAGQNQTAGMINYGLARCLYERGEFSKGFEHAAAAENQLNGISYRCQLASELKMKLAERIDKNAV
ncbi:MAG: tetratricopeptide repeat protein [Oscillospiraceae bacterium]|nr:tetratricopeptide repeat protein [Oscillospiraceae bacterium]